LQDGRQVLVPGHGVDDDVAGRLWLAKDGGRGFNHKLQLYIVDIWLYHLKHEKLVAKMYEKQLLLHMRQYNNITT
jgi:hypothetical protein